MQYNIGKISQSTLKHLQENDFDGLNVPEAVRMHIKMALERIEILENQIKTIETFLESITVADPRFKLLTDITGIGRVLGLTIYYGLFNIYLIDIWTGLFSLCY